MEPDNSLKAQRILRLEASNVKRLTAVQILPNGNIVCIGGKNGAGKSSVLDCIVMALGGASHIPEQPIHAGKASGVITIELDDMIVERKFSGSKGSTLKVTTRAGTPITSPQAILDKLIGRLSFDPMEFSRVAEKKPKEAVDILRQLAGLDLTSLDNQRKLKYDERTLVGRDLDKERGRLLGLPNHPEAPAAEISVVALTEELTKTREHNEKVRALEQVVLVTQQILRNIVSDIASKQKEIDRAESQLKTLRAEMDQLTADKSADEKSVEVAINENNKIALQDEEALLKQISEADAINVKVRANTARREATTAADNTSLRYDLLSREIEKLDEEKKKLLQGAKFPIPEISFDDTGVLLNGFPFCQGSTAERIRASVAMGLALNPTLRVVMIREGSLLDEDALAIVADMAAKNDAQVWIERVGTGKECSIIIEDGHVKED